MARSGLLILFSLVAISAPPTEAVQTVQMFPQRYDAHYIWTTGGFRGTVKAHTSIEVWLGQYVTLNLVPDAAAELNRHLVENYSEEPCSRAHYMELNSQFLIWRLQV